MELLRISDGNTENTIPHPTHNLINTKYRLVRLSTMADVAVPGTGIRICSGEVLSIIEINEGCWEFLVLKSYCHDWKNDLIKSFPGFDIDLSYDHNQHTASDVECWGDNGARMLNVICFSERAQIMIKEASPIADIYYAYLREIIGKGLTCPLENTFLLRFRLKITDPLSNANEGRKYSLSTSLHVFLEGVRSIIFAQLGTNRVNLCSTLVQLV